MGDQLSLGRNDDLFEILETLGSELEESTERRNGFLQRPVSSPAGIENEIELMEAVANLADGRSPFGLKGLFGKSKNKQLLDQIRVLGDPPADIDSWKHVARYLVLLKQFRELVLRWNALASELRLDMVPGDDPGSGLAAGRQYAVYLKIKGLVEAEKDLIPLASRIFPNWVHARDVADDTQRLAELEKALRHHLTKGRLANVWVVKENFQKALDGRSGRVSEDIRRFFSEKLGNPKIDDARIQAEWLALMAELFRVQDLSVHLTAVNEVCDLIKGSGGHHYALSLKLPLEGPVDTLLPDNWRNAWRLRRLATYLEQIDAFEELKDLAKARDDVEGDLSRAYRDVVVKRTWLKLAENASHSIRSALQAYLNAVQRIGKGTGKRAARYRQDARTAASQANPAVPCWIMPHYRVSESLPAELGCFDLVIIDEASQSDFTALPSLLRAKKILIVGDDKQVSPEGVGLAEDRVRSLMDRFLDNQVKTYRPQMSPDRSIYDLFKVVFSNSAVMLKEHFRCVAPIIEYSKREFYNHELRPLRVPKTSERLDPPLIDVLVEDGYRSGFVNKPEARFIVDEIKAIVADPEMSGRSIGVVSLLADKQALEVWERLTREIGPEVMQRHRIACGDARTFQGNERDIMFLSMVSAPNDIGAPLSRGTFAQRFNVAASRARDRMYLVRSVDPEHLSQADRFRRSLIAHFSAPFAQDEIRTEDLRKLCESDFEREMYDELTQRGYWVTPQVKVGPYRIDMVVEGHNDARLAIECDGDKFHGPDKWADDMQRERNLNRAGWGVFWRCFASTFIRRRKETLDDLLKTLAERGIEPIGAEGAPQSVHVEQRVVSTLTEQTTEDGLDDAEIPTSLSASMVDDGVPFYASERADDSRSDSMSVQSTAENNAVDSQKVITSVELSDPGFEISEYVTYIGPVGGDPRTATIDSVTDGIVRIIEVEGPMVTKRTYDIYLRSLGIKRLGHGLRDTLDRALSTAIRQGRVVAEDETGKGGNIFSVVRLTEGPKIKLRSRGTRSFEEIPPSELQVIARQLLEQKSFSRGGDEHLRAVLEHYDLKRLTAGVGTTLVDIIERSIPYVDEFLTGANPSEEH